MKKSCSCCEAANLEMTRVWRGLVTVLRRDLANARADKRTGDAAKIKRALNQTLENIRTAKSLPCPLVKRKKPMGSFLKNLRGVAA